MCVICRFEDVVYFELRGLCSQLSSKIDTSYVVDMNTLKDDMATGIVFSGVKKSKLLRNGTTGIWGITPLEDDEPLIYLETKSKLPIGIYKHI